MYYAHSTESTDKSDWQPLKLHLIETAELSEKFATKFNQKKLTYIAGLFHDLEFTVTPHAGVTYRWRQQK